MTDATTRTTIQLELDDSSLDFDITAAQTVLLDFIGRMQAAANITPRVVPDQHGRNIIAIDVDPASTTAGMEVVQGIVKEYAGRLRREANVVVGVDTTQLPSALQRAGSYIGTTVKAVGAAFLFSISRGIENLIQASFAVIPNFLSNALAEYRESEEATKKLTKALASTGEQSGKTKEELIKYAAQLQTLTNVSDKAIMGIQGLLLASEGLTGVNFDRATRGALDLAEALGGDAAGHAERLGKSLQDPVRGMKMLRDAGISFSNSQKDMIKLFVETGDLTSAQGVMLDELESRYGGASVATDSWTDAIEGQKIRLGELNEGIGAVVAESMDSFIPAMSAGIDVLESWAPPVLGAASVLGELVAAMAEYVTLTGGMTASVEENVLSASSFASALKANLFGIYEVNRALQLGTVEWAKYFLAIEEGDASPLNTFTNNVKDQIGREAELVEEAAVKKREAKKKQDKLDSEARKAAYKAEQKERDLELARGSGLVTEDEIAKKGAKQALKDAKLKIAADKKRAAADAAQDKAVEREIEAAAKKAARDKTTAEEKAKSEEHKRIVKENAAFDKKMAEEDKAAQKEKKDFDKNIGRESLTDMHDRIQDAMLLRKTQTNLAVAATKKEMALAKNKKGMKKFNAGLGAKPSDEEALLLEEKPALLFADEAGGQDVGEFNMNGNLPLTTSAPAKSVTGHLSLKNIGRKKGIPKYQIPAGSSDWTPSVQAGGKIEVKQDEVVKAVKDQTKAMVDALLAPDKMGR